MATAIVMSDAGIGVILGTFFNNSPAAQNAKLKLFCNNYTPVRGMLTSSFTEATGGGYAALTLTNASWTVNSATPMNVTYATQTFTFTGALTTNPTVYGYYVTDNAVSNVLWAQLFNATFTPANNGDNIVITPELQMSGGTPS